MNDTEPEHTPASRRRADLLVDLTSVINRHSVEQQANIPDWVIAEYLLDSLTALFTATNRRDNWYGIHPYPGWRSGGPIAPDAPPPGRSDHG